MHNIEIESKYRIDNISKIKEKLEFLGAKNEGKHHWVDTYFILPNNPEGKKYLRVREVDHKSELSYKLVESNTHKHEWETEVQSAEMAKGIIKQLGYEVDVIVDKERETHRYKNSEVVLDDVKNLGLFVEIESPNVEEIEEIANELGFEKNQLVEDLGYPDLIRGGFRIST